MNKLLLGTVAVIIIILVVLWYKRQSGYIVTSATWGVPGKQVDVTSAVASVLTSTGYVPGPLSTTLKTADPAFGTVKTTTVNYTKNGVANTVSSVGDGGFQLT